MTTAAIPWIRRLALAGTLLALAVVVFGAYVRLSAAGLSCPDWPGCYGHLSPSGAAANLPAGTAAFPDRPLEVGKAWREMIHRYAAGTLVLVIVTLAALVLRERRARPLRAGMAVALLAIVVFQALLGMWTVTWLVTPAVVTLHLLFGLTTLALLWWLWLSLPADAWGSMSMSSRGATPLGSAGQTLRRARQLAWIALAALGVQIALGGWTSTNYADVACPDFPTCQNAWWPHGDWRSGFTLWRGLGINYEGGVLANPARIAIHFTHRLGALLATAVLGGTGWYVLARPMPSGLKAPAVALLAALALQLALGIGMVMMGFPIGLATAHTAGAALVLLATLALLRRLRAQ